MLGYVVFVMRLAMALLFIGHSANVIAGSACDHIGHLKGAIEHQDEKKHVS